MFKNISISFRELYTPKLALTIPGILQVVSTKCLPDSSDFTFNSLFTYGWAQKAPCLTAIALKLANSFADSAW